MKNQNSISAAALVVLVSLLGASSGCATFSAVTGKCGCALDCGTGCDCQFCEPGCGSSDVGYSNCFCGAKGCLGNGLCSGWLGAGCGPMARGYHFKRIEVGPPAVRYRPEMPPEFLPVPVTPVLATVNPHAPPETRGAVEVDWAPPCQLTIYGRD